MISQKHGYNRDMYRSRAITSKLQNALERSPAVVLQGARQVGKSTLVRHLGTTSGAEYRTLDDREPRESASVDPEGFVRSSPDRLLILDEVQRVPDLILAIKATIDRDRRTGRFLLTGSSDLLMHPASRDSLAGRSTTLELRPYSQGEVSGRADTFVAEVLAGLAPNHTSELVRSDYLALATRGGFPEVATDSVDTHRWLDDYIPRLQRDIAERGRQRRIDTIPDLMRALAGRSATELNVASIARDVEIKADSVRRYIELLEECFVLQRVPAFASGPTREGVRRPKLVYNDSGMACALLGLGHEALESNRSGDMVGPILETFVVGEVLKQISWMQAPADLAARHYRRRDGAEVDLVLEHRSGQVVGFEVKATSRPPTAIPKGLRALQGDLGDRLTAGIVLYTGSDTVRLAESVWAVPISALWSSGDRLDPPSLPPHESRASAPAPMVGARVFWSYAHADDVRDGGRIRRLADAVSQEYEFLTGEELRLFVDEDLEWGDTWAEEIESAIEETTMFVSVASPTYFRRPECIREIEAFLRIADSTGHPGMLLPLQYGPLPKTLPDSVGRILDRVRSHQWVDLSDLRLSEEASEPWRRMVHHLATRLISAAEVSTTQPSLPLAHDDDHAADDPDLLDLSAQMDQLDPILEIMTAAASEVSDLLAPVFDAPPGLPTSRRTALMRANSRRAAEAMSEPLDRLEAAAAEAAPIFEGADRLFVAMVESHPPDAELRRWRDELGEVAGTLTQLSEVRGTLSVVGRFSRDLRLPMRRLDAALSLFEAWAQSATRWADTLGDRLDT